MAIRDQATERADVASDRFRSRHQRESCCTIVDPGSVAGGDGPSVFECRPELCQTDSGCIGTNMFVTGKFALLFPYRNLDRKDLIAEPPLLERSSGPSMAVERKRILLFAADLRIRSHIFGGDPH